MAVKKGMVSLLALLAAACGSPPPSNPIQGAAQRIEQYRKGDATVQVVNASGAPVPNAVVQVSMQRHQFLFGCAAFPLHHLKGDDEGKFERAFVDLFNFATLGFYWGDYERQPGVTKQAEVMSQAKWLQDHGITVKGHPLVYHVWWPTWLPNDLNTIRRSIRARIDREMNAFNGLIDYWDVINEPLDIPTFGKNSGLDLWASRDGVDSVTTQCVCWARAANPSAKLIVNEYIRDPDRGAKVTSFAGGLTNRNTSFDFVGLQQHQHEKETALDDLQSTVDGLASASGKPVHISEVSIVSGQHAPIGHPLTPWPTTRDGERRQAKAVADFYTILFADPNCQAITWWDLRDGGWLGAPSGLVRTDFSRKPAYTALRNLIKKKWWTSVKVRTDSTGTAHFRGFYGEYKFSASQGLQQGTSNGSLTQGQANAFTVQLHAPG